MAQNKNKTKSMTNDELEARLEMLELRIQVLENKILDGGVKNDSSNPPPPPPPPPPH